MANPTRHLGPLLTGEWIVPTIDGIWKPYLQIHIADQDEEEERPQSAEVFEVPSRKAKVVQLGDLHNIEGVISGVVRDRFDVTAHDYMSRLDTLLDNQKKYTIYVIKANLYLTNVVFLEGYRQRRLSGAEAYQVTIPFVDVS